MAALARLTTKKHLVSACWLAAIQRRHPKTQLVSMYFCSHKRLEFHAPSLGVVTRTAIWLIVTAEVTVQTWLHTTQ